MPEQYRTAQRNRILEYLMENSDRHITVEDCTVALRQSGKTVGQTTVYRFMEKLVEEGRVRKFTSDGIAACFQYIDSTACHSHFHLKCLTCGKLIHLSCSYLEQLEQHVRHEHDFTIHSGRTIFYGVCHDCTQSAKKE